MTVKEWLHFASAPGKPLAAKRFTGPAFLDPGDLLLHGPEVCNGSFAT
jgi:hypothetical protein